VDEPPILRFAGEAAVTGFHLDAVIADAETDGETKSF
jgi:hypothetical protein